MTGAQLDDASASDGHPSEQEGPALQCRRCPLVVHSLIWGVVEAMASRKAPYKRVTSHNTSICRPTLVPPKRHMTEAPSSPVVQGGLVVALVVALVVGHLGGPWGLVLAAASYL